MASSAGPALWWVRRDFRLADNPALRAAIDEGEAVLPLFVLDPVLLGSSGRARRAWLFAALQALDTDLKDAGGPGLNVVQGRPADLVPRVAQRCGAGTVHISADFAPYGRRRDGRVQDALAAAGIELRRTGSPYAVAPGTLSNGGGRPFQVFSPFHRAWLEHGERTGPRRPRRCRGLAQGRRPCHPTRPRPGAGRPGRGTPGPAGLAGVAAAGGRRRGGLRPTARLPRPERDLPAVHRAA